jgi:phosphoglycolate phosphatase
MANDDNCDIWPQAILFDMDGTLTDAAPDITASLNEVFEKRGLLPFHVNEVKAMIGHGLPKLIERALETRDATELDMQPIITEMTATYSARASKLTRPFDGVEEILQYFHEMGVKLAVCTNKMQKVTEIILHELDLAKYFDAVIGARDGLPGKPDPAGLHLALHQLGVEISQAVMVGDSDADAAAAKEAGIPVILASFGYSTVSVRDLKPDAVIEHFSELPRSIDVMRALR